MLHDGNNAYSPLICIGKDIPLVKEMPPVPCLCVSPSGRIAIVESSPSKTGETTEQFIFRLKSYIKTLRKMCCDDLDGIASDFYYRATGQAARSIDIMARNGYLTLAAKHSFFYDVDEGLHLHDILVIVSVDKDELDMKRIEFSTGSLGSSGLLFSLVTDDVGKHFTTG